MHLKERVRRLANDCTYKSARHLGHSAGSTTELTSDEGSLFGCSVSDDSVPESSMASQRSVVAVRETEPRFGSHAYC